jgi:large-conductance mechanosensitive channel
MQRIWGWLGVLGVSLFCGLLMIGIALGAIIPKVVEPIAAPVVCANGKLEITQNTTSYRPGESDTWTTDTCVDVATGKQQDVSLPTTVVAGLIYSLIIFVILMVWSTYGKWKSGKGKGQNRQTS